MSFSVISKSKNAVDILFSDSKMTVILEDGRELSTAFFDLLITEKLIPFLY